MPDETASAVARPEIEKERGRGHIGLVVLGSITGGLILGLTLTLGGFGGGRENVITGAALIALAFGMLMLVALARWRIDKPQSWALVPALGIGVMGLAGHAQGSTTERYLHASQTSYPDAAELAEARLFVDG